MEKLLRGDKVNTVSISGLALTTGIPARTLYGWRDAPDKIPLWGIRKIVKARGLTDEEIVRLIRGKK